MSAPLRIGTRGSPLALWQANFVAEQLRSQAESELVEIQTEGDVDRDKPLNAVGGDGLFTKEIQRALLERRVDVAVHSLKDLPTEPVAGLTLAAVPARGPAADVFVSQRHRSFHSLPGGAVVATSSVRRRAQLLHVRRDLQIVPIRGNVETRLRKLEEQNLDGLILARAGLERLGLLGNRECEEGRSLLDAFIGEMAPSSSRYVNGDNIVEVLDHNLLMPAVGQGALGVECRADDEATLTALRHLDDAPSRLAVTAERTFLRALGGGCLVPIGASGTVAAGCLLLWGCVLDPDGKRRVAGMVTGSAEEAERLGQQLASQLLEQGAGDLLTTP
jgi:hydroxymethylbilane synthase